MPDVYNSKIPLLVHRSPWAITIGQTTYYSVSEDQVSDEWRRHEDEHKRQWSEQGRMKFAFKYLWYLIRYGYKSNPFEITAGGDNGNPG